MPRKTVALDFDGVLHGYSRGWADGTIYDPPVPGVEEFIVALSGSCRFVVSTCREDIPGIWRWLSKYGLIQFIDDVTNAKPVASAYVDDRGVGFRGDWAEALEETRELLGGTAANAGPGGIAGAVLDGTYDTPNA